MTDTKRRSPGLVSIDSGRLLKRTVALAPSLPFPPIPSPSFPVHSSGTQQGAADIHFTKGLVNH